MKKILSCESLIFDPEKAYVGEYTDGDITFRTYQVTYVTMPIAGLTWSEFSYDAVTWEPVEHPSPSEDFFKMNIKVPVSCNGVPFDEAALAYAPILFNNPWGGDLGASAGDPSDVSHAMIRWALSEGWVVAEPGMRGNNCISGTPGEADYINHGKLPCPIVDLKAALRYLRYDSNATVIPGNKELIFATGVSSGGCGTVMLAASGNTRLYDDYLAEIGAAPGRDDVFAAVPSCLVMTRTWGDAAIAWERWGDISSVVGADSLNIALSAAFPAYQESLSLKTTFAIPGNPVGSNLTADILADYLMVYVKESAIKYLNSLGGKTAIDDYLATSYPGPDTYGVPVRPRNWIRPVYDTVNTDLVVDIGNTWEEFWSYVYGTKQIDPANRILLQYDMPIICPNIQEDGLLLSADSSYMSLASVSFGKNGDYAAVYTDFGWDYIEALGVEVSKEYKELITFQRNSVDPLYFILGEGDGDVCNNWFLRTGAIDIVVPNPVFFNLATALENQGKNVDAALVWDQSHDLTSDIAGFFSWANELLSKAPK